MQVTPIGAREHLLNFKKYILDYMLYVRKSGGEREGRYFRSSCTRIGIPHSRPVVTDTDSRLTVADSRLTVTDSRTDSRLTVTTDNH